MIEDQNLFTIKEASELIGISESELISLIMQKQLTAIRIGKAIRIKEKDLDKFLDKFVGESSEGTREIESEGSGFILYSAEQVAKILQLSVDNIWNLLKNGKLKGFKIREGRSSWRITSDNLKEFIEARTKNLV
ncbi:MAG: helix-turn-helix domain-containing protein [Cyanobacteria bacterium]|nr:helix-turn-helix domain-containing protein [Cyanobacteriota bacterium]